MRGSVGGGGWRVIVHKILRGYTPPHNPSNKIKILVKKKFIPKFFFCNKNCFFFQNILEEPRDSFKTDPPPPPILKIFRRWRNVLLKVRQNSIFVVWEIRNLTTLRIEKNICTISILTKCREISQMHTGWKFRGFLKPKNS